MTVFYANMHHKKQHLIHEDFALACARSVTDINTTCQIQSVLLEGREALGGFATDTWNLHSLNRLSLATNGTQVVSNCSIYNTHTWCIRLKRFDWDRSIILPGTQKFGSDWKSEKWRTKKVPVAAIVVTPFNLPHAYSCLITKSANCSQITRSYFLQHHCKK